MLTRIGQKNANAWPPWGNLKTMWYETRLMPVLGDKDTRVYVAYKYDSANRVETMTDAKRYTTIYHYEDMDRLTEKNREK